MKTFWVGLLTILCVNGYGQTLTVGAAKENGMSPERLQRVDKLNQPFEQGSNSGCSRFHCS